jgi:predicted Zn-dependent protease
MNNHRIPDMAASDSIYQRIGRKTALAYRQGQWLFQSVFGSGPEAIRAEESAGKALASVILKDVQLSQNRQAHHLVQETGDKLAACLTDPHRRFHFFTIQTDSANAFALPGGFIFITENIIRLCGFDRVEVGAILSHEIGHVVRGHAYKRMVASSATQLGTRILARTGGVQAAMSRVLSEYLQKDYSREQEDEADTLGLYLMSSAGMDPRGMIRVFERLREAHGEGNSILRYFSTHPSFKDRIANLESIIEREGLDRRYLGEKSSAENDSATEQTREGE